MRMIGKRLRIDLTNQKWFSDDIPLQTIFKRLGGTGLALEAFTGESLFRDGCGVVFAPGFMTGTNAPAAHWCSAVYYDSWKKYPAVSYFGGHWGAGLKQAGIQVLEIIGQAPFLILLVIEKERVSFLNGEELAGLSTSETHHKIESFYGDDCRIACIGPAGEKSLPFSSLVLEGGYQRNSAGLGAVLGRMSVKAIVVRGDEKITPASSRDFYDEARRLQKRFAASMFPFRKLSAAGSSYFIKKVREEALLPIKNYKTSVFHGLEKLLVQLSFDAGTFRRVACSGCPIACRSKVKLRNGWAEAPGYEEIVALGTLCGIADRNVILQIKASCDSLGFDPITIGGAMAYVMEKGESQGKESLGFGDGHQVLKMMTAGDPKEILGKMAIPLDDCADSEWVGFMNSDPRGDPHLALNRLTWPLLEPNLLSSGIFVPFLPAYQGLRNGLDVVSAVISYQNLTLGLESLGFCPWSALCLGPGSLDRLIKAALGEEIPSQMTDFLGRDVLMDLGQIEISKSNLKSQCVARFRKLANQPIIDGDRAGQRLNLDSIIEKYIDTLNR